MKLHTERVEREDLVLFINACLAATSQSEFYEDARGQSVALDFLHEYVCRNYRDLYARTLAAGINHHARTRIVRSLLTDARTLSDAQRREEGALIAATLRALPPQRVYRLLESVCARRVTNRRVRAIARAWLAGRDLAFDAVKYRRALRTVVGHLHLPTPGETGRFLFERHTRDGAYATPLFESWRQAHYSSEAMYALPYTVALGFAHRHKVPRDVFLERISARMTHGERLALQRTAAREDAVIGAADIASLGPTRLALYAWSLPRAERAERRAELSRAMEAAVRTTRDAAPLELGRVVAVLDDSYSSSGAREKHRRPLAVTVAIDAVLRASARSYTALWTSGAIDPHWLDVYPRGSTRLAARVIDALERAPELVVLVSDGHENDPPGAVEQVLRAYRTQLDPERRVGVVHVNPVFEAASYGAPSLGPAAPMVSVRDVDDLATVLGFARFADGRASLAELRAYLDARVRAFLAGRDRDEDEPGEKAGPHRETGLVRGEAS